MKLLVTVKWREGVPVSEGDKEAIARGITNIVGHQLFDELQVQDWSVERVEDSD